jgi:hypothetical protein
MAINNHNRDRARLGSHYGEKEAEHQEILSKFPLISIYSSSQDTSFMRGENSTEAARFPPGGINLNHYLACWGFEVV